MKDLVVVTLTLSEATAIRNATGFGGAEPTTPRELAALERALKKIETAQHRFVRSKQQRRRS